MKRKGTLIINGHHTKGWWHTTNTTYTFTKRRNSKPLIRITAGDTTWN